MDFDLGSLGLGGFVFLTAFAIFFVSLGIWAVAELNSNHGGVIGESLFEEYTFMNHKTLTPKDSNTGLFFSKGIYSFLGPIILDHDDRLVYYDYNNQKSMVVGPEGLSITDNYSIKFPRKSGTLATLDDVNDSIWNTEDNIEKIYSLDYNDYSLDIGGDYLINGTLALFMDSLHNIASGSGALDSLDENFSLGNIAIGLSSLTNLNRGVYNLGIGLNTSRSLIDGNENIAIGLDALYDNIHGNRNTVLGVLSGSRVLGSGNVLLGYMSGYNETGSNKLYISNSNTSDPLIYGEFDNNFLEINGSLQAREYLSSYDNSGLTRIISVMSIDGVTNCDLNFEDGLLVDTNC